LEEFGDGGSTMIGVSVWREARSKSYVGNGGVMLQRDSEHWDEAFALFFERASYLSQARTKAFVPEGVRQFWCWPEE
jgi:hypothetical protein